MSLKLRPYQEAIIEEARQLMRKGHRSMLICAPTGSGKTALTAAMLGNASKKNMRSLFCVHRRELVKQSLMAFHHAGVPAGVIAASFPSEPHHKVQIASIPTLSRRLTRQTKPQLIVWDESHHVASKTWRNIFEFYPDAFHIGLTATPERLDGKGLDEFFPIMIKGPSVSWLIENKWLSDYKLFAPSTVDMTGVKKIMGDYSKNEMNQLMDRPTITGSAVDEYIKRAKGKRAVVFCASIQHSLHVVDEFRRRGIEAEHLDGTSESNNRDQIIKKFQEGSVKILSNVDLFGEGFDVPAIEACIMLRPTQSLSLYLQQVGRSLRPAPGKSHAIILDHVGNVQRHGLPDQERDWDLRGREFTQQNAKDKGETVRICKNCLAANKSTEPFCSNCNEQFEKKPRVIDEQEGELQEIDKDSLRKMKLSEQGQAKSLQELIELGFKRGYKKPYGWAQKVFHSRQARRNKGLS